MDARAAAWHKVLRAREPIRALQRAPMAAPNTAASPTPPAKKPNIVRRLYDWVLSWAETPYGTPALFVLSFLESSFFPIPPDVLQIALSVGRPRRAFFYAAVSVVDSVLGGLLGWWIGTTLWDSVASFFFEYVPGFTEKNYALVESKYNEHAFLAIFTAAFTPIPYKVFTIASGVFDVALSTLIFASILGRGGRFFLVASAIFFFGPTVKTWLEKYFEVATLALLAVGALGFLAVKYVL